MLNRIVVVVSFILIFNFYGAYNKKTMCPVSYCNNAGICEQNGKCTCLTQYYNGIFCSEMINYCQSSPCRNRASCKPVSGHYVCICRNGFSGAECDQKQSYTVGLHLIVHYIVEFGIRKKFVLIASSLGTVPMGVTITAKKYLIKILHWNKISNEKTWHYSRNVINMIYRMGINDVNQIPFVSGYFLIIDVTFWELGEQDVIVNLRKLSDGSVIKTLKYSIIVIQEQDCVPRLELNSCAYPESPTKFVFYRFANIYPRIRNRCNDNEMTGTWQVFNADESIFLHDFGEKHNLLLKMPQYTMWFNKTYPGFKSQDNLYMLKLTACDLDTHTIFRCYVQFVAARVEAIISGGTEQQYTMGRRVTIDGSRSRDFNAHPKKRQPLTYKWKCSSESDPENKFCTTLATKYDSKKTVVFASSEISLDKTYTITLTVRSLVDTSRYDSTEQIISLQKQKLLIVDIQCIRNCKLNSYKPNSFVHLKVFCHGCSSSSEYKWKRNSKIIGTKKRLIVNLSEKTETITITARSASLMGEESITLTRIEGTINQNCSLIKNTGIGCFTALQSHCSGGLNDSKYYTYTFNIANITLKKINPTVTFYLPHDEQLMVTICDYQGNCVPKKLQSTLTPFKIPTTLAGMKRFFENKNTSVRMMLANNNIDPALCIMRRFAKEVKNLEQAKLIYDQYKDFEFPRLTDTDRIFLITRSLLQSLQPINYLKAEFFGKQIGLMLRSLNNIIDDMEIRDMSYQTYVYLSSMLVQMFDIFCIQTEEMARELLFYDNEDAFNDHIIKWPDFDATVTIRMTAWLKLFKVINQCMKAVGKISTQFHYPKEPPFIIKTTNAQLKVEVVEDLDEDIHYTTDFSNRIKLPEKSILKARQRLKSKVFLMQSVQFTVNPTWWYPSYWVPTSNCFSYNLYANYKLLQTISIPVFVNSNKTQSNAEPMFVDDTLISNSKISIFRTSVPPYGVLLVHFTMTTAEINVLLTLHKAPTFYQVWHTPTCTVTSTRTLVLTSHCPETSVAYMAVHAPHIFDVNHKPKYRFYMMIRQCAQWDFENNGWEISTCTALFRPEEPLKLICECEHLSTFAAREVPVRPTALRKTGSIKEKLNINWTCAIFHVIFFSCLFVLLWISWSRIGRHNVIHVISRDEAREINYKTENTIIHLRTGGRVNASTTASIILDFVSQRTGYCRIVVYQDPKNPQLIANSNCMTRISSNKLQLPAQLTIRHDGNGDYPNWYCREILVEDLKNNLSSVYTVRMWILKNKRYSIPPSTDSTVQSQSHNMEPSSTQQQRRIFVSFYQWRYRYFKSIAHSYINWFFMQPVLGPWRYDDRSMNGFQRTCIWISKFAISLCVVCAYYGRTTIYNYYDYYETSSSINIVHVLIVGLICYFTGLIVEYIFSSMVHL